MSADGHFSAPTSRLAEPGTERSFLAACFVEGAFATSSGVLPHHFASAPRAMIFGAMLSLAQRGEMLGSALVRTELMRRGMAERCDDELFSLQNEISVPADWMPRRLRELAQARDGRQGAARAMAAWDSGRLDEAIAEMRTAIGLLETAEDDDRTKSVGELVDEAAKRAAEARVAATEGRALAITTGLPQLDALLGDAPLGEEAITGGWGPGDYVIVGGDTNVGKSSVAMTMAWGAARSESHVPVGIVQIEDPRERVGNRALALAAELPQYRLRAGKIDEPAWQRIERACRVAKDVPMFFEFRIGASLPSVCAAVRRLRREKGCRVIVIDYLQAVETHEDPRLAMRNIVSQTKREAHRGEGPASVIIGLSQFRKRDDETTRPKRSDLYESAYLAQKAEHIVLMHKTKSGAIELVLDKTKDGKTGRHFELARDPDTGLLVDADSIAPEYP